ncbi:polysaccharide deacetylase family protein [Candidatus Peregrinibacteria bacterium]|jgi:peptidoglycan-N-acetylglucosamine deacetylase|nr:polysaccharide deacetylase family protein [Candidatus Peregrinibacteria bacterium]MBT5468064.1 polysaccharide deacetylase family protein [Candidatus Peregrinibacteria bacterium]MBT7337582.1 polysaccharide deacetylase family protein [Candidatus Peregrinibacteria bacterium]
MKFTTSWDDGYALDMKISELLSANGAKGTFYLCPHKQHGKSMLDPKDIATLMKNHELGAHTIKHPKLTLIPSEKVKEEIIESKKWIEELSGKPCEMFCYPYGDTNDEIENLVKEAGYKGARGITQMLFTSENAFQQNTSLQIAPFPKRKVHSRWWHVLDKYGPLRVKRKAIKAYGIPLTECNNWLSLAKAMFTYAHSTNQPCFHLWGHSHEVEKYDMWKELEEFLRFVATHKEVKHVVNSQLLQ